MLTPEVIVTSDEPVGHLEQSIAAIPIPDASLQTPTIGGAGPSLVPEQTTPQPWLEHVTTDTDSYSPRTLKRPVPDASASDEPTVTYHDFGKSRRRGKKTKRREAAAVIGNFFFPLLAIFASSS